MLNYLENGFKKTKEYYQFLENIRDSMNKSRMDRLERHLKAADEPEERKHMKILK